MEASNIIEGEKVQIVNINNGERLETYVIKGQRKSKEICLNGPAARKVQKGDVIIIISYGTMDFEATKSFSPILIFQTKTTRCKMAKWIKYVLFFGMGVLLFIAFNNQNLKNLLSN